MGSDPQYIKFPDLTLAQDVFNLSNPSCSKATRQKSLQKLQDAITEHKMASLYRYLAHPVEGVLNNTGEGVPQHPAGARASTKSVTAFNMLATRKMPQKIDFPWDEQLYKSLVEDNQKELDQFQKEEDEAEEAAGETEVQAARGKRAEFWARVGDKVRTSLCIGLTGKGPALQPANTARMAIRIKPLNRTKLSSTRFHSWERRSIWYWP